MVPTKFPPGDAQAIGQVINYLSSLYDFHAVSSLARSGTDRDGEYISFQGGGWGETYKFYDAAGGWQSLATAIRMNERAAEDWHKMERRLAGR